METYEFSSAFELGSLQVSPVHMRIEQLRPIIAAHTHSNTSYEIHYTRQGRGTVTIDGVSRPVEADTLYITGPGVVHAQVSQSASPIVEYCLYLNCRQVSAARNDPFALFAETAFWMGRDEGRLRPLMEQLIQENRQPLPGAAEMSETILKQIIIRLTRMYRQDAAAPVPSPAPLLTRAGLMPIIEDAFFYRYRTLTLSDLSRLLNLSTRQTQRLIKQNFGKTFSQKLTEARMAAASQYLLNTDLSVTEIGERAGFSSIEHFSAAFRRFTGQSPRAYRNRRSKPTTVEVSP